MANVTKEMLIGEILQLDPNALRRMPVLTDGIPRRGCDGSRNPDRSAGGKTERIPAERWKIK